MTKADWLRSEIEKLEREIAIHKQLASEWTGIDIKNNILEREEVTEDFSDSPSADRVKEQEDEVL